MFLNSGEMVVFFFSLPFLIIILIPMLIAIIYFIYLVIETIRCKKIISRKALQTLSFDDAVSIPDYEPAIMGYLVNNQRIGRREICSTLFDLIGRGVIKITLKKGFISDDVGEYVLTKNDKSQITLKCFEDKLVKYLFSDVQKIDNKILREKLYKSNLDETFYREFLRDIQNNAKKRNFFDKKVGKRKVRVHKIISKVVNAIALASSGLCSFCLIGMEELGDAGSVDDSESLLFVVGLFIFLLVISGILWCLKFLISFMYNLSCYYNAFSKKGNEDYKRWIDFKEFLKNCGTFKNLPLMGVIVWERYYAYAIGLKCSKKFFKQMKKMKIADNSIDIKLFEVFDEVASCIGTSTKKIKQISLDRYGGSHVDY